MKKIPCIMCLISLILVLSPVIRAEKVIKFPGILIFFEKKEIHIQGIVNQTKGPIELLITTPNGKCHESVLVCHCSPEILVSAMLLIGLTRGGGGKFPGDSTTPYGSPVYIYVEWQKDGKNIRVCGEDLVWNTHHNATMQRTHWIFTGSYEEEIAETKVFVANQQGLIAATYYDPGAVINNPLPERCDDTMYEVNSSTVPSKGTPVQVIVSRIPLSEK